MASRSDAPRVASQQRRSAARVWRRRPVQNRSSGRQDQVLQPHHVVQFRRGVLVRRGEVDGACVATSACRRAGIVPSNCRPGLRKIKTKDSGTRAPSGYALQTRFRECVVDLDHPCRCVRRHRHVHRYGVEIYNEATQVRGKMTIFVCS
jgi:hypothetical protein